MQARAQQRQGAAQQKFALLQTRGIWRYALVDSLLIATALAIGGAVAGRGLAESLFSLVVAFVMIALWRALGWKQQELDAKHEQAGGATDTRPKTYGRLRLALFALALIAPILYVSTRASDNKTPQEPEFYVVPQAE